MAIPKGKFKEAARDEMQVSETAITAWHGMPLSCALRVAQSKLPLGVQSLTIFNPDFKTRSRGIDNLKENEIYMAKFTTAQMYSLVQLLRGRQMVSCISGVRCESERRLKNPETSQ